MSGKICIMVAGITITWIWNTYQYVTFTRAQFYFYVRIGSNPAFNILPIYDNCSLQMASQNTKYLQTFLRLKKCLPHCLRLINIQLKLYPVAIWINVTILEKQYTIKIFIFCRLLLSLSAVMAVGQAVIWVCNSVDLSMVGCLWIKKIDQYSDI